MPGRILRDTLGSMNSFVIHQLQFFGHEWLFAPVLFNKNFEIGLDIDYFCALLNFLSVTRHLVTKSQ